MANLSRYWLLWTLLTVLGTGCQCNRKARKVDVEPIPPAVTTQCQFPDPPCCQPPQPALIPNGDGTYRRAKCECVGCGDCGGGGQGKCKCDPETCMTGCKFWCIGK